MATLVHLDVYYFFSPQVYVLAYPVNRLVSLVQQNSKLSFTLLGLLFVFMVVSLSIFLFLILRAAKREMFLCAALVKQMESTHQAERTIMLILSIFCHPKNYYKVKTKVINIDQFQGEVYDYMIMCEYCTTCFSTCL